MRYPLRDTGRETMVQGLWLVRFLRLKKIKFKNELPEDLVSSSGVGPFSNSNGFVMD
jgi:hypothetical protein